MMYGRRYRGTSNEASHRVEDHRSRLVAKPHVLERLEWDRSGELAISPDRLDEEQVRIRIGRIVAGEASSIDERDPQRISGLEISRGDLEAVVGVGGVWEERDEARGENQAHRLILQAWTAERKRPLASAASPA